MLSQERSSSNFEGSGEWDGEWKQIEVYEPWSSTGFLIQKIGGQRYVFIGRGDTPCPLEVLSYPGMEKLGELNLSEHPVGKNVWPAIIPVTKDSGTAYYLLHLTETHGQGQEPMEIFIGIMQRSLPAVLRNMNRLVNRCKKNCAY